MKNENVSCLNIGCEYFDNLMELNCSYSEDNKECIKTEKPIASHAVLDEGWRDAEIDHPKETRIVLCWADGEYQISYYDALFGVFFGAAHDMMMLEDRKHRLWWDGKLPDPPAFV